LDEIMPLLDATYSADTLDDAIAYVITNNPACTTLELRSQGLDDADVICLCEALAQNDHIESLDLHSNAIGVKGAIELAQLTRITSLDVGDNFIGTDGAKALAENTILRSLDVSFNEIGEEGAAAFADNSTLRILSVFGNSLGYAGCNDGARKLSYNKALTSLDIGGNNIGDVGAGYFADNNRTLKSLMVDDNNIEDVGAFWLAQNSTLTFVSIDGNEIDDEILDMLHQTIKLNRERPTLLLGCMSFASMTRITGGRAEPLLPEIFLYIVSFLTTVKKERKQLATIADRTFFQPHVSSKEEDEASGVLLDIASLDIASDASSDVSTSEDESIEDDEPTAKRQRMG
jgi:hypothetical protein